MRKHILNGELKISRDIWFYESVFVAEFDKTFYACFKTAPGLVQFAGFFWGQLDLPNTVDTISREILKRAK